MPENLSRALKSVIDSAVQQMHTVAEAYVVQTTREHGWTRKQELGHLIDSATNNHVRFVVSTLEGKYSGPKYDQNGWVDLHRYADMDWIDLVNTWHSANSLLVRVIAEIPDQRLAAQCRIGGDESEPVTLQFLIEDYIDHMQGHLRNILPTSVASAHQ